MELVPTKTKRVAFFTHPCSMQAFPIPVFIVHNVNLDLANMKYKNHIRVTLLFLENKFLIIGRECFHKRFKFSIVGKIFTENSSVLLRFGFRDYKRLAKPQCQSKGSYKKFKGPFLWF